MVAVASLMLAFGDAPTFARQSTELRTAQTAGAAAQESDATNETHPGHWRGDEPVFFSDLALQKGDYMHDAVVIKGNTTIDGLVEHDSVTVWGDARINGEVKNNLVVVLGSADLGPQAVVGRNLVVVGGRLTRAATAKIGGDKTIINVPGLRAALDWVAKGLLLGRPFPPSLLWVWGLAGIFLLINLFLLMLFPQPVAACVETIQRKPITSFFTGVLVKLLSGLVFALLAISVIGWIVLPFLAAACIVAFLFGKITVYYYAGLQLAKATGSQALQKPALMLILGTAMFYLLYMIPFIGFVAWGFSGVFGLGAVVLAAIDKLRSERRKAAPPAPPVPAAPPPGAVAPPPAGAPIAGSEAAHFAPGASGPIAAAQSVPGAVPPEVWQFKPAGFWIRLAALALDAVLFLAVMNVLGRHNPWQLLAFLWLCYCVVLWAWKGTTLGGLVMGIKVARTDGRPMDFSVALIRALASILSALALGIGFLWVAFSPDKQSWHDKIAGTTIFRVP